jgi:hypothetical protein
LLASTSDCEVSDDRAKISDRGLYPFQSIRHELGKSLLNNLLCLHTGSDKRGSVGNQGRSVLQNTGRPCHRYPHS